MFDTRYKFSVFDGQDNQTRKVAKQTGEHIGRYICKIEQADRHIKNGRVFPGHESSTRDLFSGLRLAQGADILNLSLICRTNSFCSSFLVFKIGSPAESSMQGVVSLLYAHGTNI